MQYNYNKLIGRIVEILGTRRNFAKQMEWSERTTYLKLTGKKGWKQNEIAKAVEILKLSFEDIPVYFFCLDGSDELN